MKTRFFRVLLAVLAGALAVPAFAPLGLFPLAFVSLACLVVLLERAGSFRAGFCIGLGWGLGAYCVGIAWLVIALWRYGDVSLPISVLIVFLFCALLALFPAPMCAAYARWRSGGTLRRAAFFGGLWTFAEWLRGTAMTGFPWLAIGYSQTPPSPVGGYFSFVGVYGVAGAVAFMAGLIGVCAAVRAARQWKLSAALIVAICSVGWALSWIRWAEQDGPPLAVSLVQPNIDQLHRWDPEHFIETLRINADLVRAARGDLVVLPEAALPLPLDALPEGYVDTLSDIVSERGASLITGVFTRKDGLFFNASVTLGAGAGQHYAKSHLVPFGEYAPPFFGWFYEVANIPMSMLSPSPANQPPFTLFGREIAVSICYEDLFGAELISTLPRTGLMLNLSNLAWYGDSFAQPQHLQIARARVLETARPMLRSTNTGMTALILPDASVSAMLPAFTREILEVEVAAFKGLTPYARWGNALALAVAGIGVTFSVFGRMVYRKKA